MILVGFLFLATVQPIATACTHALLPARPHLTSAPMKVKRTVDFVAFAVASLLTVVLATFVAWWYSLGLTSSTQHALWYLGMFAMAVGIPSYYVVRAIR